MNLILHPEQEKQATRLKCHFVIEPYPSRERLRQGALAALDLFVRDMRKREQRWEYLPSAGIRLQGPFAPIVPIVVHRPHIPTSREMRYAITQGAKFRAGNETITSDVTPLAHCDRWEYELSAVFVANPLIAEMPDKHEELEVLRAR